MKKTYTAVLSKSASLVSRKITPLLLYAALAGMVCFSLAALAGPTAGVTNGNTVLFQGDQSAGVNFAASDGGPTTILVSNVSSGINVNGGGVAISGHVNGANLTAIVDSNLVITTSGSSAAGVFAGNAGVFDGSYQVVTNSYTIYYETNSGTNVLGGVATNVVVNGTNEMIAGTNVLAGRTNVVSSIVTNFQSGSGNNYTSVAPAGGATVINGARITTTGFGSYGIFAQSEPGTITLTTNNIPAATQSYGDAGPVNVQNSGDITTSGDGAHGIFAQSLGGVGPENSPTSGNGSVVTVVTTGGTIATSGNGSYGIFAQSLGGYNIGGESGGAGGDGNGGGAGGDGGFVTVQGAGTIGTTNDNAGGIFALSQAGNGGNGGNGGTVYGSGGSGGPGGKGSNVFVNGIWTITTYGTNANGITAQSLGGIGGSGGDGSHFIAGDGGNGGGTGDGGSVTVISGGDIHTHGFSSIGIFARSLGGFAGSGGNSYNAFYGDAGSGNSAGAGGVVNLQNTGNITTEGDLSQGIYAESVGGGGGEGGSSGALVSLGASGGAGGNAGDVTVTNFGTIFTRGSGSHGIEAESLGGGGGDGGDAGGLVALGSSGAIASTGAVVTVYSAAAITTLGSNSDAILAQSIGGGGGNAGSTAGAAALGSTGGGGGDGGAVHVFNSGQLQATGQNSYGIFAQSIGGGGGNGGGGAGLVAIGGGGGTASQGDVVTVVNSGAITSTDNAIFAQSIGGGGGNGGNAGGWFPIGGSGGGGGNGAAVTVDNSGNLHTTADNASGLLAQSVGGGGGNGGNSVAVGAFAALAIGGAGGNGGNGSQVSVASGTNSILTQGNNSYGIDAESVGGGGGNGGYAVSVAIGKDVAAAFAIGGAGGGGGSSSGVGLFSQSDITTFGTNSHGIFAQSIGGGGGAGGFSVAVSGANSASLSLSMGGSGGGGGNGGLVNLTNLGSITTYNDHSYGIVAQSIGGGGGDGGFAIAASLSGKNGVAASLSFGGTGATGGVAEAVGVINDGRITTWGDDSHGIMAQSVGGGGGSGGFSIAGDVGGGTVSASFGGAGGGAGAADNVLLSNSGDITTHGNRSDGLIAQSVGGGGGNGGFSIAGDISQNASLGLSFGGTGGSGGSAGSVILTNLGTISTGGDNSQGILAQSLGGGGGDGGFGGAGAFTRGAGIAATLAFGGNATTSGVASAVSVYSMGPMISTIGTNSDGILAQSIGGGGGNGGFAAAGSLGTGSNSVQAAVTVGGNGGTGNISGAVRVENTAGIMTGGNNSMGIFAESVGGGGGNGGMAISGTFSKGEAGNVSVALGGHGGIGGNADSVTVDNSGNIFTLGDEAHGIFAQSVGGGGGNGGMALALDFALGNSNGTAQFALAIGGNGGDGGFGSNVVVRGSNTIFTAGQDSYGVFAQSVGGGGGNGGMAVAATAVFRAMQGTNIAVTIAVGGNGGAAGDGGSVLVDRAGAIMTTNDGSYGIVAQSIGGGGGNAGQARSFSLFTRGGGGSEENTTNVSFNVSVGGNGGNSGSGGAVTLTNAGSITSFGAGAYGILAQSVGGGGGTGGDAHSSTDGLIPSLIPGLGDIVDKVVNVEANTMQIAVGGSNGVSGDGGQVIVNQQGSINTFGAGSYGIFAQSVGGGGGVGGTGGIGFEGQIGIGGAGGAAGNGGAVNVLFTGTILTAGDGAAGVVAQSIGGGGGIAGNVDRGMSDEGINIGKGFAFGRDGGSAGSGGTVNVTVNGNIYTGGNGADGIFAQSVGGGGGQVGDLGNSFGGLTFRDFAGSVGGAGDGSDVTVSETGQIVTYGTNSTGIFAQSAGGTNGFGGNVRVTLNGSIFAEGQNSDGIFAQSGGGYTVLTAPIPTAPAAMVRADAPSGSVGTVTVTISSNSFVEGGLGDSVGVRFEGGNDNILTNYGTITTMAGLNGTAVSGISANSYLYNYGLIIGSIDLGTNGNGFNNVSGGLFRSGAYLGIGSGNTFINSGILSVAAPTTIQDTILAGGFLQTSNGSLVVGLASPTAYDALKVSDSASLDGNLGVYLANYLPIKGAQFNVLTATNILGQFASVSDPLSNNYALALQTVYSPTNVDVQVIQASFSSFAHTRNQKAVAKNLNSFSGLGTTNTSDPRGAALITFLNTQDASELPGDFDLISPASLGAMFDLDFASLNLMSGNIQQRMSEIRLGNHEASGSISAFDNHAGAIQVASLGHQLPPMNYARPDDWGFFAAGHGQYVDVNGNTNAPGYHFDSGGVTLGIDRMVCDNIAVGVTGDYTGTRATLVNDGKVTVNSGRLGVYGTWFDQNSYVEGLIGGGYNDYSTERAGLGGNASGHATGADFDFMLGGGYYFRTGNLLFGPAGNLHYAYAQVNQFTETGSMAPLIIEDNSSQSFLTDLGARVAYQWHCSRVQMRPELQLAWQHEYLDDSRAIDSRLASGAGNIFTVNSPTVGRDSLTLDATFTIQWNPRFATFAGFQGNFFGQNFNAEGGDLGFSVSF
jgi:uncharacterized protein YhjY with autotransporter beta-barrel domain